MKTVFVSIYDGDTEKNILRSGALDGVICGGHRVVILVRGANRLSYYKKEFEKKGVIVELLPKADTFAEQVWFHLCWNSLPTISSYVKRHDLFLVHKKRIRYALEMLAWYLGHVRVWRELLRAVYFLTPDRYAVDLFERYRPNLLFAPNMFGADDCRLLRMAKKLGVRTLTMAKSWDVPTTRGFTRVKADEILVFNEINRREIIEIGDYEPNKVHPVGFPQFDAYTDPAIYVTREEFYRSIGVDPKKILVLFAVPGDFKNPYSHEIINDLDAAVEAGRFKKPIQFIARFHPKYPSTGETLKGLKHFIKDRPGTYFSKDLERAVDNPSGTTFQWTFTDKDIAHIANSIYHSAAVVNTESTMTLDAAAIGRPAILVGFDGRRTLDYWQSIRRNYSREHLQAVLETRGVRFAKNLVELIEAINAYICDPELDREGRDLLRKRLLYKNDGKAGERISKHILKLLEAA